MHIYKLTLASLTDCIDDLIRLAWQDHPNNYSRNVVNFFEWYETCDDHPANDNIKMNYKHNILDCDDHKY